MILKIATFAGLVLAGVLPCAAQPATPAATTLVEQLRDQQADPRLAEKSRVLGRRVASICASCHGEGGNSALPDVPNLAGQNPVYLLEQLRLYAEGKRKNPFMEGTIRAMRDEEKVGIALFYATHVVESAKLDRELAARGQAHFNKVCVECHGAGGRGEEKIARIAGQQSEYLRASLKRYRDAPNMRFNPQMSKVASKLSNADIDALSEYVRSLK